MEMGSNTEEMIEQRRRKVNSTEQSWTAQLTHCGASKISIYRATSPVAVKTVKQEPRGNDDTNWLTFHDFYQET
jgi:hypothetical protein